VVKVSGGCRVWRQHWQ